MLVLSRCRDQAIVIDTDIEVRVLEIRRGSVQLGIKAPGRPIDREEIHQDKLRNGRRNGRQPTARLSIP
jgi:carbon storage regulator CsrA